MYAISATPERYGEQICSEQLRLWVMIQILLKNCEMWNCSSLIELFPLKKQVILHLPFTHVKNAASEVPPHTSRTERKLLI